MGLRRLGSLSFRDNLTMAGVVQFHAKLLNLDTMPGFKVRWHYSGGDVVPETDNKLMNTEDKSSFIRKGS